MNQILTILVPVFNEEKTIITVLEKIKNVCVPISKYNLLIINDGSTDNTLSELKKYPNLYNDIITLPKNKGKGAAVKAGISHIKSGYILIQDADLEYDPRQIPYLWETAIENKVDVLATSRFSGPKITLVHYFWHKVGNKFITFIFNILNNTTFTDIYSGYLLFNHALVDTSKLRFNRWGQQAEILTFLVSKTKKIYEVPITYFGRTYSEGKKIRGIATLSVIWAIFLTKIRVLR